MTKVESLNPLRTLHNAVPLKEMDNFFDKATFFDKALVTPVTTPSRKGPSKKLAARTSHPTQLLEKMPSHTTNEDIEGVTDLLTEAIQKLDS